MNDYKIGDLLKKSQETIQIEDNDIYKQITVKLYGKGVILRGLKSGKDIGTKRQYVAKAGQLILSKIDARNGAFGLVPPELEGAVVTSDFPLFECKPEILDSEYFNYLVRTDQFLDACIKASKGTTNRQRLKEGLFLAFSIDVPSLEIQRKAVSKLKKTEDGFNIIYQSRNEIDLLRKQLLQSYFLEIINGAPLLPMSLVAPIVRRKADPNLSEYPELGLRSFGKGTFHKPALKSNEVGTKKLYEIYAGDIVFSNVFAWEGAVSIAQEIDQGRFGSHRFITCVTNPEKVLAEYLLFFFQSPKGLYELGKASPGGAGRNRTLGLKSLERIFIPIADYKSQQQFILLLKKMKAIENIITENLKQAKFINSSLLQRSFQSI